jgi:hypothetical protein
MSWVFLRSILEYLAKRQESSVMPARKTQQHFVRAILMMSTGDEKSVFYIVSLSNVSGLGEGSLEGLAGARSLRSEVIRSFDNRKSIVGA